MVIKSICACTLPKHSQLSNTKGNCGHLINKYQAQTSAQQNHSKSVTQQLQEKKRRLVNNSQVKTTINSESNCVKEGKVTALCVTKCFPFVFETVNISWKDISLKKQKVLVEGGPLHHERIYNYVDIVNVVYQAANNLQLTLAPDLSCCPHGHAFYLVV